eukprot:scaffold15795_cov110-Isochrysis_galbana.AAC.9
MAPIFARETRALSQQPRLSTRTDAPTRATSSCAGATSSAVHASASSVPEAQPAKGDGSPQSAECRAIRRATATASKVGWARKRAGDSWAIAIVSQ